MRRGANLPWVVVGAGVAGAHVAQRLHAAGRRVLVLEKARGPGGRCSTRRIGDQAFNHGALSCRARDPRFRRWMTALEQSGVVTPWRGTVGVVVKGVMQASPDAEPRWTGTPENRAWASGSLEDVPVRTGIRVMGLQWGEAGPHVLWEGGACAAAGVVLTPPLPQIRPWIPADHAWHAAIDAARYTPTWSMMARGLPPAPWPELALFRDGVFTRVMQQGVRADDGRVALVAHAASGWSQEHLERTPEEVSEALTRALEALGWREVVASAPAHRWRYATVAVPLPQPWLEDPALGLWATGDAFARGSVEGAWCAAERLADHLLEGQA